MKIRLGALILIFGILFRGACNGEQSFIKFNIDQLDRMLLERPLMSILETSDGVRIIDEECPLYQHAVQLVSAMEFPVLWSNSPPDDGARASHYVGDSPLHAQISITELEMVEGRGEMKRRFESLWFSYLFELNNINQYKARRGLYKRCALGEISKGEFIVEIAKLEHKAMTSTIGIVNEVWIPWAIEKKIYSIPSDEEWSGFDPDFAAWIAKYNDPSGYPWVPYGDLYELVISRAQNNESANRWRTALDDVFKTPGDIKDDSYRRAIFDVLKMKEKAKRPE